MDYAPLLKMIAKTWGSALAAGGAPFRFAPEDGTRFFGELHGWREFGSRSMWQEARRVGRAEVRLAWLWTLLARLSPGCRRERMPRFSGIVPVEER